MTMTLLINRRKLNAAASSMHQFCNAVRLIYPQTPDNPVVEAATVFLYERLAHTIFGKRFADKLRERWEGHYKFNTTDEVVGRVARIDRLRLGFEEVNPTENESSLIPGEHIAHVRGLIRALLYEAGCPSDDPEVIRDCFPRFDDAVRRIKRHLEGIRNQNRFLMR